MYIICSRCVMEDKEDSAFYLGKYFPREGWYINNPISHDEYNKFLEDHSHEEAKTLFGYDPSYGFPFSLYFEAGTRSQDQILMKIGEMLENSGANSEA